MAANKPTVPLARLKSVKVTLARDIFYENVGQKGDTYFAHCVRRAESPDGAEERLNAPPELHAAIMTIDPRQGDILVINNTGHFPRGPWTVQRVNTISGKPLARFGEHHGNGYSHAADDPGDQGTDEAPANGQTNGRSNGRTYPRELPGTVAGDEGLFVECLAQANRIMKHPVVQYIWWEHNYEPISAAELLDLAVHLSINRSNRGEREPQNADFASPPPEGKWDHLIARMKGVTQGDP